MATGVVVLARFLLTGIALLLGFLAAVAWNRRKDAPEATVFSILVASMAVYAFGYAGEIAQTEMAAAKRWLDVEYLALPWAGALWVLAACKHNGIKARTELLFIIPVITFVGHYTNFHNLFYTAPMTMVQRGPFWVLTVQRGPLSLLDNAFLMVAFLAGAWMYLSGLRHASSLFRKQAMILLVGALLPFLGYFYYLVGLSPWGLDVTPIVLGVTCVLWYYGIFHCGIFDLAPRARNLIFNSMRDAVVILDTQDRLLDFNPAAQALLPVLHRRNLGAPVLPMLSGVPVVADAVRQAEERVEIVLEPSGLESSGQESMGQESIDPQSFEVRTWPLFFSESPGSRQVGRAVILADVSAQVRLREELRSRAETDPLTGVANRRRFYQALEMECARFPRSHAPLSVLMIDLDFFKDVNDRYGHDAGDAVLGNVAQILLAMLRKADLLARYGGEEFSVLLVETNLEGAMAIAERIRHAVCQKPVEAGEHSLSLTVSVGVASYEEADKDEEAAPEILLKRADLALYRAKARGRNCVATL